MLFWQLFAGKAWEMLSYVVTLVLYLLIRRAMVRDVATRMGDHPESAQLITRKGVAAAQQVRADGWHWRADEREVVRYASLLSVSRTAWLYLGDSAFPFPNPSAQHKIADGWHSGLALLSNPPPLVFVYL